MQRTRWLSATEREETIPSPLQSPLAAGLVRLALSVACVLAALAAHSASNAQAVTLDYGENDPRYETAEPCRTLGGEVVTLNAQKVCSGIDKNDTFCIVGSDDAFPCRGLYKHVVQCNSEFSRPALNPFFCGAKCENVQSGATAQGSVCVVNVVGGGQCLARPVDPMCARLARGTFYNYDRDGHVYLRTIEPVKHDCTDIIQRIFDNEDVLNQLREDQKEDNYEGINEILLQATKKSSCQVAALAIAAGADVNLPRYDPPLKEAVLADSPELAELLVKNGANISVKAWRGCAPPSAGYFPREGCGIQCGGLGYNYGNLLHATASNNGFRSVGWLVGQGLDIHGQSGCSCSDDTPEGSGGWCWKNSEVDKCHDEDSFIIALAPLDWAVIDEDPRPRGRRNLEVAKALIAHGANPNRVSTKGGTRVTPMHHVRTAGMVSLLAAHGGDVNAEGFFERTDDGVIKSTPLHYAAAYCRNDHLTVEALLAHGANVNARDGYGHTPLQLASAGNKPAIVAALIAGGASPQSLSREFLELQSISDLYEHRGDDGLRLDLVTIIVSVLIAADVGTKSGERILNEATRSGDINLVEMLINNGIDVNYRRPCAPEGCLRPTPLFVAASSGNADMAALLIENGANVNIKSQRLYNYDRDDETPLHAAVRFGGASVVALLIESEANIDALNFFGHTPLHDALRDGEISIAALLIENGANVNIQGNSGLSPLHYAVINDDLESAKLLIMQGASINVRDDNGYTPFRRAVLWENFNLVSLLLENGADVDLTGESEKLILHAALEHGELEVAKLLIEGGVDITVKNSFGMTSLHFALLILPSHMAASEIITLLVQNGADVNVKGFFGDSVLFDLIAGQYVGIISLFLENGVDVQVKNRNGRTLLHSAADSGESEIASLLLKSGTMVNVEDMYGEAPLHLAAQANAPEVIKLLIDAGADANAEDKDGETPLHAAAWGNALEAVKLLIDNGAEVKTKNNYGQTSLHAVALDNAPEIAKLLIDAGADVNAEDDYGYTPMDDAILGENSDMQSLLHQHGGRCNKKC